MNCEGQDLPLKLSTGTPSYAQTVHTATHIHDFVVYLDRGASIHRLNRTYCGYQENYL